MPKAKKTCGGSLCSSASWGHRTRWNHKQGIWSGRPLNLFKYNVSRHPLLWECQPTLPGDKGYPKVYTKPLILSVLVRANRTDGIPVFLKFPTEVALKWSIKFIDGSLFCRVFTDMPVVTPAAVLSVSSISTGLEYRELTPTLLCFRKERVHV